MRNIATVNEGVTLSADRQYVWTVAGFSCTARLAQREVYRRPWRESAAYESDSPWSMAHRRAYLWMGAQFAKHKGRRLRNAPVWLWFNREDAAKAVKRDRSEEIVALSVPSNELLVSQYDPWADSVLYGVCVGCDSRFGDCGHERALRRVSWQRIFDRLNCDSVRLQAIVDRLDPDWLVCETAEAGV